MHIYVCECEYGRKYTCVRVSFWFYNLYTLSFKGWLRGYISGIKILPHDVTRKQQFIRSPMHKVRGEYILSSTLCTNQNKTDTTFCIIFTIHYITNFENTEE